MSEKAVSFGKIVENPLKIFKIGKPVKLEKMSENLLNLKILWKESIKLSEFMEKLSNLQK